MTAVVSPAALQQICEATAASWLIDWSGLVGQVSRRSVTHQPRNSHIKNDLQTISTVYLQTTQATPLHIPHFSSLSSSCIEDPVNLKDTGSRGSVTKRSRSYRSRKKARKMDKTVTVKYDGEVTSSHWLNEDNWSKLLGQESNRQDALQLKITSNDNNDRSELQYTCEASPRIFSSETFDEEVFRINIELCSNFLRHLLPPCLVNQIMDLAWKKVSRLVALGSHNECVQKYQVADWVRRAPALLKLGLDLSSKSFPLNIAGIPECLIKEILEVINQYFPLGKLSTFEVPKTNFKRVQPELCAKNRDVYRDILLRTSLTSVILNSEICDDSILRALSQVPLKELEIGGSLVTENGVVNGLCALPVDNASEVYDLIRNGLLQCLGQSPLRKSLQKFDMSFQNINNQVCCVIPAIFSELLYYNPHKNMVQCMQQFARLDRVNDIYSDNISTTQKTLKLMGMNVGHSSRDGLNEIARMCPYLQELTLIVELDAEETLSVLQNFPHLSNLTVMYYPSFPTSPPKLNGMVLQAAMNLLKSQLRSLSLTGFNILGNTLFELSCLPELCSLSLTDCWLSNPRNLPQNPFPCLEKLCLNFMPHNTTMQLLSMGGGIQSLHLDFKGFEWEGNALTDAYIKHLVTSGMVKSLQSFMATSSYLTLESLMMLASLPYLKTVGHLASWGLTEEELQCVDHSGPSHILCYK